MSAFDLVKFFDEKAAWSLATFGPQQRVSGVVAHIRKELAEIREALAAGDSLKACEEFVDVALLSIDLAWRSGPHVDGLLFATALREGGGVESSRAHPMLDGASSAAIQQMLTSAIEVHLSSLERTGLWWRTRIIKRAAMIWANAMAGAASESKEAERRLLAKYAEIQTRKVADWRDVPVDQPIEHIREEDKAARVLPTFKVTVSPSTVTPAELAAKVSAEVVKILEVSTHCHDSSALVLLRPISRTEDARLSDVMTIAQLVTEHHELAAILDDVRRRARVKAKWQGDNERLRAERHAVRDALGARPNEHVLDAAKRVMDERDKSAAALEMTRGILEARPHESTVDAAKRAATSADLVQSVSSGLDEARKVLGARAGEDVASAAKRVAHDAELRGVGFSFVVPAGTTGRATVEANEGRPLSVGYTLDESPAAALAPGEESPQ